MRWSGRRFHSLSHALGEHFSQKVVKLSLDGGFTCPNRDGTLDTRGCIFCSDSGAGEFAGARGEPLHEQLKGQISLLSPKWPTAAYIAYFQNFTGTYAPAEVLRQRYEEALSFPGVVGLAVATRPDALGDEAIALLGELARDHFVWVELGLQSMHEASARFVRRGYTLDLFNDAVSRLLEVGVRVVTHLILGLPGESADMMRASAEYVARSGVWGLKLHLLHILENTDLHAYWVKHPFDLLTRNEYVELVISILERLPPELVIHRLTGDGPRESLVAPLWPKNKRAVLNAIEKGLKARDLYQGARFRGWGLTPRAS